MKFKIFGIGQGGNQSALKLLENGICTKDDIVLVNSTNRDIPKNFDGKTTIFNASEGGCGKERTIAKQYMIDSIKSGRFDEVFAQEYDSYVFITSLEGGTGSGSTPIIAKYCSEVLGKTVHIIAFAGFNADASQEGTYVFIIERQI